MPQHDLPFIEQLQLNLERKKNPLAKEIYAILAQLEPQLVVALTLLAIPRWFNTEMLAAMMQLQAGEALLLFDKLRYLPFISKQQPAHYIYRPGVREILIAELRTLDNTLYLELHQRAYQQYATQSPLLLKDKTAIASLSVVEGEWVREQLYHLLIINPAKGHELFDTLFIKGYQLYLEGDSSFLEAFGWQASSLLRGMREWLQLDYYEALPAFIPHHFELSVNLLTPFIQENTPLELRGWALARLGILYTEMGQCSAAIEILQKSLKQISDNDVYQVLLYGCLGNAYLCAGNLRMAQKYLHKGIKRLQQSERYAELAIFYNNLGNVCLRAKNWGKAQKAYEKSLLMKRQQGDLFGEATTMINMGTIYHQIAQEAIDPGFAKQKYKLAINFYQDGITLLRELDVQTSLARPLYKLAILYHQQGQLSLARIALKEALHIVNTLNLFHMHHAYFLAEQIGLEDF